MEATFSSVPETRDPLKMVLIVSVTLILFGTFFWYLTRKYKTKNESSNIRKG